MTKKLEAAEAECKRLQDILNQNKQGLGSATSEITSLTKANSGLKSDLETVQKELRESKNQSLIFRVGDEQPVDNSVILYRISQSYLAIDCASLTHVQTSGTELVPAIVSFRRA